MGTLLTGKLLKSHENKDGAVWINVYENGNGWPNGRVQVVGNHESGYRVIRFGTIGQLQHSQQFEFGDSGAFFERRKNAENYALTAAIHLNGFTIAPQLLEPEIYDGQKIPRRAIGKERYRLFWAGARDIDPTVGWNEIDPDCILDQMPSYLDALSESFWHDDDFDDDVDQGRSTAIYTACVDFTEYLKGNFLTAHVDRKAHEILTKTIEHRSDSDLVQSDRGYVLLLSLADLKNKIPLHWILPNQSAELAKLISRLYASLPNDVSAYINGLVDKNQ